MRRATITTTHDDEAAAARVAAALAPDNTDEMDTRTDGGQAVTTVVRETTTGLQSTVDDYVVNCQVATRLGTPATDSETERVDADGPDSNGTASNGTASNGTDSSGTDSNGQEFGQHGDGHDDAQDAGTGRTDDTADTDTNT